MARRTKLAPLLVDPEEVAAAGPETGPEIPPPPPRVPMQWRRALRCVRALLDEPAKTERAFDVFFAIGTQGFERNFQRLVREPGGRALLAARPSLLDHLADRDALEAMRPESLGRAYRRYLERYGFDPEGLVALGRTVQERWQREEGLPQIDALRSWYRDRTLLLHDLFHVLTGYGADDYGEATLLAFSLAQLGGRADAFLTVGAALRVAQDLGPAWFPYVARAWRRGRRAVWLHALPFEELLPLPLATVRRMSRVEAPGEAHPSGILRGSGDDERAFAAG